MTANHLINGFLRRVLSRMKELGLNQSALARRMGVTRAYVTKVFSGDVNISFGTALKLAQAVQMDFRPQLKRKKECNSKPTD